MAYSTISKPSLHFNTKLYTGNASSRTISGIGFQPDFTWTKNRGNDDNNYLFDAVRGTTKYLISDSTAVEGTTSGITGWNADGYTLGSSAGLNANGVTACSWNWKAGGGAGSANTDGSINTTSTSVNTTAGFSISKYTGTGSAGTIGHGLGVKPDFWQVKATSETRAWYGWHKDLALGDVINFSSSGAKSTDTSLFTNTAPTTSVINLGNSVGTNNNGITFVCYAFAEKKGYSKFGSYKGNGNANGTFIYTGFKPAFVIVKIAEHAGNWMMYDNKRNPHNLMNEYLYVNAYQAAASNSEGFDFLSNGFKMRNTFGDANTVNNKYIYMAFAEEPLVANVGASIPATAR
jgi:hypothetical protein